MGKRHWDLESGEYQVVLLERRAGAPPQLEIWRGRRRQWRGAFEGRPGLPHRPTATRADMLAALAEADGPVRFGPFELEGAEIRPLGLTPQRAGRSGRAGNYCPHGLWFTKPAAPRCRECRRQDFLEKFPIVAPGLQWIRGASPRRSRRTIPNDTRIRVAMRSGGRCSACGATRDLQFDHVLPFSKGGSDDEWNLQLLCGSCNRKKGARLR